MENSLIPLVDSDVAWCVRWLPVTVKSLLQTYPGKLILAGGFIRACIASEEIHDIDLFPATKELGYALALSLAGGEKHKTNVYCTANAFSVPEPRKGISVQFIHRWLYATPEDILPSFDFSIAQAAIWYEATSTDSNGKVLAGKWKSLCSSRFYSDLAAKRLVYLCPQRNEDAGGSILRVLKFYQRGYRIPIDSLGAVIAGLVTGVRASALSRSEADWAFVLTGLLHEVDPAIDPSHIAHLPAELVAPGQLSDIDTETGKDQQ